MTDGARTPTPAQLEALAAAAARLVAILSLEAMALLKRHCPELVHGEAHDLNRYAEVASEYFAPFWREFNTAVQRAARIHGRWMETKPEIERIPFEQREEFRPVLLDSHGIAGEHLHRVIRALASFAESMN